jgi:hypothetical protein
VGFQRRKFHLVLAAQLQEDGGDAGDEDVDEDEGAQQNEENVVDGGVLVLRIDVVPHVVLPGLVRQGLHNPNKSSKPYYARHGATCFVSVSALCLRLRRRGGCPELRDPMAWQTLDVEVDVQS